MLKKTLLPKVKKLYHFFQFGIDYIKIETYPYTIDKITKSSDCEHKIKFRVKSHIKYETYTVYELFGNHSLFDLIGPVNSFICGLIFSLEKNLVTSGEFDNHIDKLCAYDYGILVGNKIATLESVDISKKVITININNHIQQIKYLDFIKKPYLLNSFRSYDAAQIGVFVMDYLVSLK